MKYGSVCSGIEAASVAWHSLGWEAQWYSEIEHFPSEVLKHRFPDVPNLGDMTQLTSNPTFNEKSIDLLVGGTPCQSFSVAGLRGGLADPRGNLMLTFLALADAKKPKWIVWENVPGVLSSNGGRDFATFLTALGNIGYGFAYRVLDAQHFGVAQRRRRVFVVGYLGDWRPAAAVLFESESLQRNPKPSRAKRQETSNDAQGSVGATSIPNIIGSLDTECGGGKLTHQSVSNGHLIPSWWNGEQTAATLTKQNAGGNQRMPDKDNFGAVIEQVAQPQYFESHPNDSRVTGPHDVGNTVSARYGTGGGNTPLVSQPIALDCYNQSITGDKVGIIREQHGTNMNAIAVDCFNQTINEKTSQTIGSSASDVNHYGAVLQPTIIDRAAFNQGKNAQYESRIEEGQTMSPLVARGPHAVAQPIADLEQKSVGALCARDYKGVGNQYVDEGKLIASPVTMAIRRLTPKECERLQGFPDDWTKIPYRNKPADQCPDGPRYKACGNSMAVPVMRWIGQRIEYVESLMKDL